MTSQIRVDEITNRSGLGTVTIYDNGFEFTGITTFTEDVDITGGLTIGGVLTYEDVTNIDSVGVVTARGGLDVSDTGTPVNIDSTNSGLNKIHFKTGGTTSGYLGNNSTYFFSLSDSSGNQRVRHANSGLYQVLDTSGNVIHQMSSTGKTGIGTAPVGDLTVLTTSNGYVDINGSGGNGAEIRFLKKSDRSQTYTIQNNGGVNELVQHVLANSSGRYSWSIGGTERLRIHSNGNVQVKTDGAQLLGAGTLLVNSGSSSGRLDVYGGSTNRGGEINLYGGSNSDGIIQFRTGAGANQQPERMRIDSSGCVRVGNTHSQTTSSDTKRIALGAKASIWGWTSGNINGALTLADNYYWDGANNRAIEADEAAFLTLRSGTLRFGTTDSTPSAGGVTGLYEKFRITSDGKVSVNHDSPNTRLYVRESGASISTGNAILNSTQKGIRLVNSNNDDTSLGLWFTTGDSHHAGISGQRNDSANTWGTDLRFYTHEAATNDLTYARERHRINPHGLLINRKGNNAANTGGTILGRYKYTQHNQGSGYAHLILGADGRKLQNYINTNCYCIITVCVTGTGTNNMFCQYYYHANSSPNSSTLTHMYGNSGSSSNRPYMNLQNTHDPAWLMSHNGGYRLDIEVAIYGGANLYTYTDEFGDFAGNP